MKFLYSGPTSGVTLQNGQDCQEVMLHTGKEVDLPEAHEYIQTLVALGHLTPVKQATKTSARTSGGTNDQAAKGA